MKFSRSNENVAFLRNSSVRRSAVRKVLNCVLFGIVQVSRGA